MILDGIKTIGDKPLGKILQPYQQKGVSKNFSKIALKGVKLEGLSAFKGKKKSLDNPV